MKIGIIGYSGFVGENLCKYIKFDYLYNSKNINNAMNTELDILYFTGLPATKWLINQKPNEDIENIENIKKVLNTMKIKKIILISTIDIYNDISNLSNEESPIIINPNNYYGKHRYEFEEYIKNRFNNYNIIRLPALFGNGLKKNVLYDLINNNNIEKIALNSYFQWYNIDWLYEDIQTLINNSIIVCNLFTEPLKTIEIIKLFNYDINLFDSNNAVNYNCATIYSKLFNNEINNYIRSSEDVLNAIKLYIAFTNIKKDKLVISNICTKNISQEQFLKILKNYGLKHVEIAPTKFIEWEDIDKFDNSIFSEVKLYSFQSITFKKDNLNIFDYTTSNKLLEHLKKVIDLAYYNNVKILVFGSPKNRKIFYEDLDGVSFKEHNDEAFASFFRKLGDYCKIKNIKICIEPNSKKYNCNYINNITECEEIVRRINHPNIKLMVDLGNAIMENDRLLNLLNVTDILEHVHISQEFLDNFVSPHNDNILFKTILDKIQYNKNITLEMLIKDDKNELKILNTSIKNFIRIYGN